jgi:hypothetical protein
MLKMHCKKLLKKTPWMKRIKVSLEGKKTEKKIYKGFQLSKFKMQFYNSNLNTLIISKSKIKNIKKAKHIFQMKTLTR